MGRLGLPELLVIFVILVLLFGAAKIPQLGKGLGEAIRNFKKGLGGSDDEDRKSGPTDPNSPQEPR
jgi:sec-independent protein translocase protein TatA